MKQKIDTNALSNFVIKHETTVTERNVASLNTVSTPVNIQLYTERENQLTAKST